jgi:hypothetical protein
MIRARACSAVATTTPPAANGQLPAIVERIEKLDAERKATSADIRKMYTEAESKGCQGTCGHRGARGSGAAGGSQDMGPRWPSA